MRITLSIPALLAGAAAVLAAPPTPVPDFPAAYGRGAACLAGRLGRQDLGDPYLAYVYPQEALPVGAETAGTTYRQIDAQIMLALLARDADPDGPLASAGRAAETALAAATPAWKRAGLFDFTKGAAAGGVALDTFCIVGWLVRDREMAGMVAAAASGGAWLPEGLYEGDEAFRRSADECWCLRMLAEASPPLTIPMDVLERIASTLKRSVAAGPARRGTFYEALHLGMGMESAGPAFAPAGREAGAALMTWAREHARDETVGESLPEWINLASATWLDRLGGAEVRAAALARVAASQQADGCWRLPGASPSDYGSSFLTMRALLALAPYRLAASEAFAEEAPPGDVPAPKAARPAQ